MGFLRVFLPVFALVALQATSAADESSPKADGAPRGERSQSRPESPRTALDDSEWNAFQSLIQTPADRAATDQPAPPDMAQRRELARQIAEARRKLAESRERYAGTPQAETLDVARQLLDITRARLLGNASIDDELAANLISDAMNRIQLRIDTLRAAAARSENPESMNAQLDGLQERLELMRRRIDEAGSGRQSPEPGLERVEQLYDIAQQKLDEAYERAAEMPDSEHLVERLNAAQRRLNKARAGFEARVEPELN